MNDFLQVLSLTIKWQNHTWKS